MFPKAHLLSQLKHLPQKSGIYQYYDTKGQLLYIGKAKNLRHRIKSYFKMSDASPSANLSPRIHHMILQVASLQTILVNHELEALILENSLIKQLKPRYNILLRDDKTYPYIYIDLSQPYPRPQITRIKRKAKDCIYFGPFCSGSKDLLESLYELLPLVQKGNCLREKKHCLFFQIQRCLAPCEGRITQEDYQPILTQAIAYLKNKKTLLAKLEEKMLNLAQQERFEEALILRERIKKITHLNMYSDLDLHTQDANWDIIALAHNAKYAILLKLYMRDGKIISSDEKKIPLHQGILESQEILSLYQQALFTSYQKDLPYAPKAILLPQTLCGFPQTTQWQEWLYQRHKIQLLFPKRGEKKRLVDLAIKNAQELLKHQAPEENLTSALQELFEFKSLPYRIEIFDTSHHAGSHCVGGMVVYEGEKFLKNAYRHYLLDGQDEYSQMREVLVRRAKDFSNTPPPDLWLLDGGSAQLSLAKEILQSAGVEVDLLAIAKEKLDHKAHRAKGRAKDLLRAYSQDKIKTYALLPSDKRLQFCQKLRDEAHRWAINFHRKRKIKGLFAQ